MNEGRQPENLQEDKRVKQLWQQTIIMLDLVDTANIVRKMPGLSETILKEKEYREEQEQGHSLHLGKST